MAIWNMLARLRMDSTAFERNSKRARTSLYDLQKQSASANAALVRMARQGMALVGLGGGIYAVVRAFRNLGQTMSEIDRMGKTADRIGITTEALAALEHAASLAGVSQEQLSKGLELSSRNLSDAAQNIGTAQRAVKTLGLDARELIAMDVPERLFAIADAMGQLPRQADKIRVAMEIFGRSGAGFVTLFGDGSKSLREMTAEAERLGLTFNRFDARRVEEANDAVTRMKNAFKGLQREVVVTMAPFIEVMAKRMTAMAIDGQGMGDSLVNAFEYATVGAMKLLDVMKTIGDVISFLPNAAADLGKHLGKETAIAAKQEELYKAAMKRAGKAPYRGGELSAVNPMLNMPAITPRMPSDAALYSQMRKEAEEFFRKEGLDWNAKEATDIAAIRSQFAGLRAEMKEAAEASRARMQAEIDARAAAAAGGDESAAALKREESAVNELLRKYEIEIELLQITDKTARAMHASVQELFRAYQSDLDQGIEWSPEEFEQRREQLAGLIEQVMEYTEAEKAGTVDIAAAMARLYDQIDDRSAESFAARRALVEQEIGEYQKLGIEAANAFAAMRRKVREEEILAGGDVFGGFRVGISAMQREMTTLAETGRDLAEGLRDGVVGALTDAVFEARDLGEALRAVVLDLAKVMYQNVMQQGVTRVMAAMMPAPAAKGAVFGHDGAQAFAMGGVVRRPTLFAFAGGTGLMGEAGPEAIMPLARDGHGRLGVRGGGDMKRVEELLQSLISATVAAGERQRVVVDPRPRMKPQDVFALISDYRHRGGSI